MLLNEERYLDAGFESCVGRGGLAGGLSTVVGLGGLGGGDSFERLVARNRCARSSATLFPDPPVDIFL